MSSETSTDTLQPWQLFTLAGLLGATAVVFVSRGHTPAGLVLLSLTIFGAAVVGLAVWWTLAPLVGRERSTGPQILGGRTHAALEREKALVLRSIKELEFDHAMRKISDRDFAEMSARLRARAAGLIRQLDAGAGYRGEIEREVARRLGTEAAPPAVSPPARATSTRCGACETDNDADARFCKRCGRALG